MTMKTLLQVSFQGWTATPRMPFILSGNAVCMPTPSYSLLLGLVGCCVGRPVEPEEVRIGFRYAYDATAVDIETRHRLVKDGGKIKSHSKGTDAYSREFHVNPKLTLWLDKVDWLGYFKKPVGAPALGRSQDLMKILSVEEVQVTPIEEARINGTLLPFTGQLNSAGQLVQLVEAYRENEDVGTGRTATASRIFLAIPFMSEEEERASAPIAFPNLYQTANQQVLYLHDWQL